jgi:aryl-alcohol dehydrogenase-like predicted oxidoreductase
VKYRTFGRTGWQVSEIAFGGWQLGGGWGAVDDNDSLRTLARAYDQGINFVDTAQYYGDGRSESVIGESLRRWNGAKIYVATKIEPLRWPSPEDDNPAMRGRYPRWYLREQVNRSLERLGVDRLDLLQLHCWLRDGVRSLDWLEAINELRLEGRVDQIGVSIRDYRSDEGVDVANLGLVASLQVIFNIFEQGPAAGMFSAAARTGTSCIARVPLDSGALGGTWTSATYDDWEEGSQQKAMFRGDRFSETLRRVESVKKAIEPYFSSLPEAAIRFSLSAPEVSTVIPGMRSTRHVDQNASYSDGAEFPEELLGELLEHNWPRNYYQ